MRAITFTAMAVLLALGACASKTASKTQSRVTDAATTPLSDLNLMRAEIPPVLVAAQQHPYQLPPDSSCENVTLEIHKLDEVLGADLDTPTSADSPSLIERGSDAAENTAVGMVQRTAEGLIPFRSWVRKLSGAERYSKRAAAAIAAGSIRRAFLKGVGASHGCVWMPPPQIATAAATSSATSPASAASQP